SSWLAAAIAGARRARGSKLATCPGSGGRQAAVIAARKLSCERRPCAKARNGARVGVMAMLRPQCESRTTDGSVARRFQAARRRPLSASIQDVRQPESDTRERVENHDRDDLDD